MSSLGDAGEVPVLENSQTPCQCRSDGFQRFERCAKAWQDPRIRPCFQREMQVDRRYFLRWMRSGYRSMGSANILQSYSSPIAKRMLFPATLICIKTAATMSSVRVRCRAKLPFGMRVQHACAIGHHLCGSGIALLIVDMINRFDSTIAMDCNGAHSFKIAVTIHRLRDYFDAAQCPRIDSNDSCWRPLAASASMPRKSIGISRQCCPITRSGRPAP